MKKNIEKQSLGLEGRSVLSAHIRTLFKISEARSDLTRREMRKVKKVITWIDNQILFGDWEDGLTAAFSNDTFGETFRKAINLILDASPKDLEEKGLKDDAETVILEMRRVGKVYEYMTGRDVRTGKKIHIGALDA